MKKLILLYLIVIIMSFNFFITLFFYNDLIPIISYITYFCMGILIQSIINEKKKINKNKRKNLVIKNKSKLISNEEILEIIDLLDDQYKNLDVLITIESKPKNLLGIFRFIRIIILYLLSSNYTITLGEYNSLFNEINIYTWSYFVYNKKVKKEDKYTYYKLLIITNILHEIRHAYQKEYLPKIYDDKNYEYKNLPSECDAREFTKNIINQYKNKINLILNIPSQYNDWEMISQTV